MSVKMLMGIELCNLDCMGKPQSCWTKYNSRNSFIRAAQIAETQCRRQAV